jgi:hypothetical protein
MVRDEQQRASGLDPGPHNVDLRRRECGIAAVLVGVDREVETD